MVDPSCLTHSGAHSDAVGIVIRKRPSGYDQWGEPLSSAEKTLACRVDMSRGVVNDQSGRLVEFQGRIALFEEREYADRYVVKGIEYSPIQMAMAPGQNRR